MRDDDHDHRIPKAVCPKCGYKMDCTTHAYGNAKPKVNDISMCLSCGYLSKFNADLTLREATNDEREEMLRDPRVLQAQVTRANFVGDRIIAREIKRRTGTADSTGHGQPL